MHPELTAARLTHLLIAVGPTAQHNPSPRGWEKTPSRTTLSNQLSNNHRSKKQPPQKQEMGLRFPCTEHLGHTPQHGEDLTKSILVSKGSQKEQGKTSAPAGSMNPWAKKKPQTLNQPVMVKSNHFLIITTT